MFIIEMASSGQRSQDLRKRLVPKQQIFSNKVTFNTSIHATRCLSRASRQRPPAPKLPPMESQAKRPETSAQMRADSRRQTQTRPKPEVVKEEQQESIEETVVDMTSPFKFIEYVQQNNIDGDFVYLEPDWSIEENDQNPTRLRIVPASQIDKEDFWTLSRAGLSHVKNSIVEFMPLNVWLRSCELFKEVMKIPFFRNHRQWKSFTSWKRSVVRDQMVNAGKALKENLFIVHPILRPAFFNIEREIQKLNGMKLFNLRADSLLSLNDFAKENEKHRAKITKTLEDFLAKVTEMGKGCPSNKQHQRQQL